MGSIRIGTLFGFDIRLDYSWFVVLFLVAFTLAREVFPGVYGFDAGASWVLGAVAALLLFGSVLAHELSHCVVARGFGIPVNGITLFLLGGVAEIKGEPGSPREELLIAGVGPLTSVLLGLASLGLSWALPPEGALAALFNYTGIVNLALAVFNLVPAFPLDGGRMLRSGIWLATRNLRAATGWAASLGQVFGWGLLGYALLFEVVLGRDLSGLWLAVVGGFLVHSARASYRQTVLREELAGVPAASLMSRDLPVEDADLRVGDYVRRGAPLPAGGSLPVVRAGQLTGVVRTDALRRLPRHLWDVTPLGALAHCPEGGVIQEDQDAWSAVTRMDENGLAYLLVVRDGRLCGVIEEEAVVRVLRRPALVTQRRLPAA